MKKITVLILMIISILSLGSITTRASTVIIGPSVIHKAKNTVLPITDILDMYSSSLGDVSISIDEYTGNGNLVGEYHIEVYATDGTNIHSKEVTIVVLSSLPSKVRAIGNYSDIYTNTSKTLTLKDDIIPALEATGFISTSQTTVGYVLINQYTANYDTPGEYLMQFRLLDASGYDETFEIVIHVKDSGTIPEPDIVYTPPKSIIDKVINLGTIFISWAAIIIFGIMSYKIFFSRKVKAVLK